MFGLFCIFTLTDDGKIIFLIKRNIFIILPITFCFWCSCYYVPWKKPSSNNSRQPISFNVNCNQYPWSEKLTCAVLSFACETRNDKAFTRKEGERVGVKRTKRALFYDTPRCYYGICNTYYVTMHISKGYFHFNALKVTYTIYKQ